MIIAETQTSLTLKEGSKLEYLKEVDKWVMITAFKNPTPREKEAIATGTPTLGFTVLDGIPFFCYNISDRISTQLPWQECPFNPGFCGDKEIWLERTGMKITLLGIDLTTSEIYSERKLKVDKPFADKWLQVCREFKPMLNYRKSLNEVYATYPIGTIGDFCTQTTKVF